MMKNLRSILVLTALCVIGAINANAQNPYDEEVIYPYANDSLVYEGYDQGAWEIDNRQKYVLYPDRRPDYARVYQGNTSTVYLFDYVWDGNNKLSGFDLKFNFGGQEVTVTELRLVRDANGNVIEEITKELDQPGSPLKNNSRVFYSYNAQNKLVLELSEDWDDNVSPAAWVKNSKTLYTYDANGKRETQVDSFYSINNGYYFSNKLTFEYNANGKLIREFQKNASDVETGRRTYTYNAAGFLTEEIFETKDGSNYVLNSKDSIILDANNRVIQEFEYSYDFTVNKVIMTGRMNAMGSTVGIFSESKLFSNLIAYPNPTDGTLNFKLNTASEKNVEVFNIVGEKVMDLNLNTTQNSIDLSKLSNGIYTIIVRSAEGISQNKVILSK